MGAWDGMNSELASRIQALMAAAREAGFRISPGSGFRSYDQQADLYRKYLAGTGNLAAPPGRSNHNHGLAMDLNYGSDEAAAWANANAARFGLAFPVSGENWHVEMLGDEGSQGYVQGAQQMGAIGFDTDWVASPVSQEDRQDALMQSYMDVITGAQRDALLGSPDTSMVDSPVAAEVASPALAQDFGPEAPASTQVRQTIITPSGQGGEWKDGDIPPPGYVPPGDGVDRWRDVAVAALRYTGLEPTSERVALMLRRIGQESSGDPMAVNDWDVNAQNGDPTKGLMQNLGSAFAGRAKELANRGIFDGFANMVASIRYSLGRYGSVENAWNRPGGY